MSENKKDTLKVKNGDPKYTLVYNKIIEDERITIKGLNTFIALKKHANNVSGEADPSINTIAKISRLGIKSVREGIKELVKFRYLSVDEQHGENGRQTSNLYTVYSLGTAPIPTTQGTPLSDLAPGEGSRFDRQTILEEHELDSSRNLRKEEGSYNNIPLDASERTREPSPPILKNENQEIVIGSSATVAVIDTQEPETVLRLEPSEYGDLVNDLKDILTPYSDQNLIIEPEHKAKIIEIALRDNYGTRAIRQAWADFQEKKHGQKFHWFYKDILSDPAKLKRYELKPKPPKRRCEKHKTVIFGDFCRDCAEEEKAVYNPGETDPLTEFLRTHRSTMEVQK